MSLPVPPFNPWDTTTNVVHLADLGKKFNSGGKEYILVRSTAGASGLARKLLVTAVDATSKLPTFLVTTSTTADDPLAVGVCDPLLPTVAALGFFLLQTKGPCEILSAGAIAAGAVIGTSTTAGKIDDASITIIGAIGVTNESAGGADENVACQINSRY